MRKLIIFIFLLYSCSSSNIENSFDEKKIDFYKKYSFSEYKKIIENYNKQSSYPNIDK